MRWSNPAYIQSMILAELRRREEMNKNRDEIILVPKSWGWEKWFANTPDYCGKELFVKRGQWSSKGKYHYHKIKDETFYVIKGNLIVEYVNEKGIFMNVSLAPGMSFRVKPGIKHKFSTITWGGCHFIEASTHHEDEDSYRCYYDRAKGEWVEV